MVKTWSTPPAEEKREQVPCALCGGGVFRQALSCGAFAYVRCVNCGLVQINPQPLPEAVARRYGEASGKDYLAYELEREKDFLALQELSLADIGFAGLEEGLKNTKARPRFLDAGCATGALLARLRDRGWEVTGVEICGAEADYARRERGLDIKDKALEEADLSAAGFEVIHGSHLIEHLNRPERFIARAARLLVPGGTLLITTPNIAGFQARLFGAKWRSAIFDHLYLFSVNTLSRLLVNNGFVIEKIITWGGLAGGIGPRFLKNLLDKGAKRFGFGDVMMVRARRP
jgi:2-polyprenyl-3-methyl-5-hydroxy-6-metoxy-1,4-benzoquinol methylase